MISGQAVKVIGDDAFSTKQLTSVTIPDSVIEIQNFSFFNNELTSVKIPSSVRSIGYGIFNNNQFPDSQAFVYARKSDGSEDKTKIISYCGSRRDNVIIPNSVINI